MARRYVKDCEQAFCDGVYLRWNADENKWELDNLGIDGTVYFDGEPVDYDEKDQPFIGE
jgi:hypothetical protein